MTENTQKNKLGSGQSDTLKRGVTLDMSRMSLDARARLDVMIEKSGDPALRQYLSYAVDAPPVAPDRPRRTTGALPDTWTIIHVLDRLEEAFEVLATQPRVRGPKMFGNAMPQYEYEQFDHNAQRLDLSDQQAIELERSLAQRNIVRLQATPAQISRMDQALWWPAEYLADMDPCIGKAVILASFWAVTRTDAKTACFDRGWKRYDEKLKVWTPDSKTFFRDKMEGITAITQRLIAGKIPVS